MDPVTCERRLNGSAEFTLRHLAGRSVTGLWRTVEIVPQVQAQSTIVHGKLGLAGSDRVVHSYTPSRAHPSKWRPAFQLDVFDGARTLHGYGRAGRPRCGDPRHPGVRGWREWSGIRVGGPDDRGAVAHLSCTLASESPPGRPGKSTRHGGPENVVVLLDHAFLLPHASRYMLEPLPPHAGLPYTCARASTFACYAVHAPVAAPSCWRSRDAERHFPEPTLPRRYVLPAPLFSIEPPADAQPHPPTASRPIHSPTHSHSVCAARRCSCSL